MDKQWYLLSSKPHKDPVAEQHLNEQGYEVYRPLAKRLRKRNNKMITVTESLFPSYMFILLDILNDDWSPIRSTVGVNKIVRFGHEPAIVPKEVIQHIKVSEEKLGETAIDLDRFKEGDSVTMVNGPFKGINSIFLSYDGEQRAMILLEIMNSTTKMCVSPVELAKS